MDNKKGKRTHPELKTYLGELKAKREEADRAKVLEGLGVKSSNPERRILGSNFVYAETPTGNNELKRLPDNVAKQLMNNKGKYNINRTSHDIWRNVTAPTYYGAVPQYVVEQTLKLQDPNMRYLVSLDLETAGGVTPISKGGQVLSPTQVAVSIYDRQANEYIDKNLNIALRPDEKTSDFIDKAIAKLETQGYGSLNHDEFHTLKELIAYGGDGSIGHNGVINKINSKMINSAAELKPYLKEITEGYKNLKNGGLQKTDALEVIGKFFGTDFTAKNSMLVTYNGINFDLPVLRDTFGGAGVKTAMDFINQANHLDVYQTINQVYGDILGTFGGTGKLSELFKSVMGKSMEDKEFNLRPHYGIDDTKALLIVTNQLLSKKKLPQVIGGRQVSGGNSLIGTYSNIKGVGVVYDNSAVLKNGTRLFAKNTARIGSPLDGIIDIGDNNNVISYNDRSVYANRMYKLKDQFTMDYEGKSYYVAQLHNIDDNLIHQIARTSKEELQSAIHGSFSPYSKELAGQLRMARKYLSKDRARQEFDSIWNTIGKARKYAAAMNAVSGAKDVNKAIDGLVGKKLGGKQSTAFTKHQAQQLKIFNGRLGEEMPVLSNFLNFVDDPARRLTVREKNFALRNLRQIMNAHFQPPTQELTLPDYMKRLDVYDPVGNVMKTIDASTAEHTARSINALITNGVKNTDLNFSNVKVNAQRVIADLQMRGIINTSEASEMFDNMDALHGGKATNSTSGSMYIANMITKNIHGREAKEKALQTIQSGTSVTRSAYIGKAMGAFDAVDAITRSVSAAKANLVSGTGTKVTFLKGAEEYINQSYNEQVKVIEGVVGKKLDRFTKPASITDEINALAISLSDADVGLRVYSNGKTGITLAMYAIKDAEDVINNGLESKNITKVDLPIMTNGILSYKGISRVNNLQVIQGRNGQARISTAQHQVLFNLRNSAGEIAQSIVKGNLPGGERTARRAINRALSPLAAASMYATNEFSDSFAGSTVSANWLRGGYVDISQLVNKQFEISRVKNGEGYMRWEDLGADDTNNFIRDVVYGGVKDYKYATKYGAVASSVRNKLQELGVRYNVAATKSELLWEGVFGTRDPRSLVPLGGYGSMAKENLRQVHQYQRMNLDDDVIVKGNNGYEVRTRRDYLAGKGIAGDVLNSRINPVMMTDTGIDVLNGTNTGFMLRTLRVDDFSIKDILTQAGYDWDNMSDFKKPTVHEQTVVMPQRVADMYLSTREKRMVIESGSGLTLADGIKAGDLISGKVTIGSVMQEEIQRKPFALSKRYSPGTRFNGGQLKIGRMNVGAQEFIDGLNGPPKKRKYMDSARPLTWEGSAAKIREINALDGGDYEVVLDEYDEVTSGSKFFSAYGGNAGKGTARVVENEMFDRIADTLGLEGVDLLHYGEIASGLKKDAAGNVTKAGRMNPNDIVGNLNKQLNYAINEYMSLTLKKQQTVGSVTLAKAQENVNQVLSEMIGKKVELRSYNAGGHAGSVFTLPAGLEPDQLNVVSYSKAMNRLLGMTNKLGKSMDKNFVARTGAVQYGDRQLDLGYELWRRANTIEYADAIGAERKTASGFEGVKYGLRELEMLRDRKNLFDISTEKLYNMVEEQIVNISPQARKDAKQIQNIILSADNRDIGTYKLLNFESWYGSNGDALNLLPETSDNRYTRSQLKGTLFDKDIAGKQGFMFELPTQSRVGENGQLIDRIFMPSLEPRGNEGKIRLDPLQQKMYNVYEQSMKVADILQGYTTGNLEVEQKSLNRMLGGVVHSAGEALESSKGYIANTYLSKNMAHSGRAIAQTMNIADYGAKGVKYATKGAEQEGVAYISRNMAEKMLHGMKNSKELMGMMENDGLAVLVNRYPSIHHNSVLPSLLKISDEVSDKTMTLTLGMAARLKADYDGDVTSFVMPYVKRVKATVNGRRKYTDVIDQEAYDEMLGLIKHDTEITRAAGQWAFNKFQEEATDISKVSMKQVSDLVEKNSVEYLSYIQKQVGEVAMIKETEARLQKSVGQFSNISAKYRRLGEAVGDALGDRNMKNIVSSLTSVVEQKAISSKHIEEMLDNLGAGKSTTADVLGYVRNTEKLKTALNTFEVDDIIKYSQQLGMFKQDKDGKWLLDKIEGVTLPVETGRPVYMEEFRSTLSSLKNAIENPQAMMNSLNSTAFLSKPSSADKVLSSMADIEPKAGTIPTFETKTLYKLLGIDYDEGLMKSAVREIHENNRRLGAINGEDIAETIIHPGGSKATATIGSEMVSGIAQGFGKFFEEHGKSALGVAGAAAGLWAISAAARGPNIEHEPVQAKADQAPSADGTYVDPGVYAGAPKGSEPTAYLSQRGRGYEKLNVKISGTAMSGMSNEEIADRISSEIRRQSPIDLNIKINSQDDREKIDRQWVQDKFALAMNNGYAH